MRELFRAVVIGGFVDERNDKFKPSFSEPITEIVDGIFANLANNFGKCWKSVFVNRIITAIKTHHIVFNVVIGTFKSMKIGTNVFTERFTLFVVT